VPSPANNSTESRQSFWLSIVRILLVEILVLLVLSGAIVAYLNWSSDVAWAEFIAASKQPAPEPTTPMQTVRGPKTCGRRA
jgi:hypothetical protein